MTDCESVSIMNLSLSLFVSHIHQLSITNTHTQHNTNKMERIKSTGKFWELAGSAMGNAMGIKKEKVNAE